MRSSYGNLRERTARLIGLASLITLVSCSGSTLPEASQSSADVSLAPSLDDAAGQEPSLLASSEEPQRRPQLIKNASLQIAMADVDDAIKAVSGILRRSQGDLLELSDDENSTHRPRQVLIRLRVPQSNLEAALEHLQALGTVEEQSITAEDVSTQLVDLQARVRNLRKSEEALLGIMEQSGSIPDVLEVTRELNTVRESIERSDAHLKNLQNRVAYSTISLTLVGINQPVAPTSSVGETIRMTWQTASSSMYGVSIALLQLLLWLLVFSPYIGIFLVVGWLGRRYWQRQRTS